MHLTKNDANCYHKNMLGIFTPFVKKGVYMGKDLKGKELGVGLYQRKDGRYEAKATIKGIKIDLYDNNLAKLKKAFNKAKAEAENGISTRFEKATLDEWFEFWFDTYKVPALKETSIRPMKNKYKSTFGKILGHRRITDLKNLDFQYAMNELLKTDIAVSSIREALGRITSCLASAMNNGLIKSNPCFDIVVPWEPEEPVRRFFTIDEQNRFLQIAKTTWYWEMFYTMFCTGLRIGEVGGLKWVDVDFNNKCFKINQAIQCNYVDGIKSMGFTSLKTPNSYRTIPFMGGVEDILKTQREKQIKEKKRLKHRWRGQGEFDDLVFTTTMGSPITRYIGEKEVNKIVKTINLQEAFDSVREGREPAEFEHAYPHAIRHSFCTRCFECGMNPKVVQALMGHARYSTTIDIYTHVMGITFEEEADKFAAPVVECATEFPDLTKIKSA